MLLDEGKLARLLQKEYKHGYDVIVAENGVTVKSSGWMVTMEAEKVPRKVLGVLVEHMGILPQAPASMTVKKGADNQELLWDMAMEEMAEWRRASNAAEARVTPVMFRGCVLWQTQGTERRLYGVAAGLLQIMDNPERSGLVLEGERAVWSDDGQMVYLDCYRPSIGTEAERWRTLETADWVERE